jgi:hypothetical protein
MLNEVAPVLFGSRWQSEIGRALGVSDRSVRRWIAGDSTPEDLAPKLRRLERIARIKHIRGRLVP